MFYHFKSDLVFIIFDTLKLAPLDQDIIFWN